MTTAGAREFECDVTPSPADLANRLGAAARLRPHPERVTHHQWFDTFDWRLFKAGLALEVITGSPGQPAQTRLSELAHGTAQSVLTRSPSGPGKTQPVPVPELLASVALRARLAPIIQMRALLPVAAATGQTRTYDVLNADAKTVARLVVETPRPSRHDGHPPPCHMRLEAIRGYEAEADRLTRRLTGLPGLHPSSALPWASGLVASGRSPGDYSGRFELTLEPELPAAIAVRSILARLAAGAEANIPGVLADLDTEFLHDLRVAVRRGRSALKLLGDTLPGAEAAELAVDLKWMGDLTTPTRDLDVYLLQLDSQEPASGSAELAPFRAFLQAQRRQARGRLARGLRSRRWRAALQRWRQLARSGVDDGPPEAAPMGAAPVGEMAVDRIRSAYRRCVRLGVRITGDSPATDLHALRKRCKELRYLLEFFGSLLAPRPYRAVLDQLKALQDCLGEFQDTQVQRAEMEAFADQMLAAGGTRAATFMALGRAADQLESRQRLARGEFNARFAGFADRATRRQVARLGPARSAEGSS